MAVGSSRMPADDRRRAILDIAREVFMTEGYAAASMSTIAARLGGSKGTLYNYFPSKEALFAAFMHQECATEAELAHAIDNPDGDVADTLQAIGRKLMRFLFSEKVQTIHRLVIAEAQRFPEVGRTFYLEGPKAGTLKIAAVLQTFMDEGRLRKADAFHAAEQFADLCKAGYYQRAMWNVAMPTDAELDANVADGVRVFMAGYAP